MVTGSVCHVYEFKYVMQLLTKTDLSPHNRAFTEQYGCMKVMNENWPARTFYVLVYYYSNIDDCNHLTTEQNSHAQLMNVTFCLLSNK